ncbi:glycosyltransferase family 2 protein [Acidimicrobiaceae bacterium]|nr:glycosyltransferase family 2 protein [Acidimicrobiaceae bacterium]
MDSNSSFNNFSIVIPIYNEEDILEESLNNIISICERTDVDYEIIISENGSTDNTKNLAIKFEQSNSKIVLIKSDNPNYGEALKRGFLKCKNEVIISFDIDYYSENFLKECLCLEEEYAGLIASKRLNNSEDGRRLIRKLATNFFVYLLKFLFKTKLSDTHGMKAIKKSFVNDHINLVSSTQDLFDTELLLRIEKSGEKFKEVPAKINEIRPSVSLIYKRIPRTLKSLLKLKINFYRESLNTKNL